VEKTTGSMWKPLAPLSLGFANEQLLNRKDC